MCGHIGGTLAAVSIALSQLYYPLPYIMFGTLSLVGACAILLVPETLGKPLPQTLDDMETNDERCRTSLLLLIYLPVIVLYSVVYMVT